MSASKNKVSGKTGAFLGMIGMSAIVGVLVTAMVTPAVALTGLATSSAIGLFENLPSYLAPPKISQKSNIFAKASDGSNVLLASFFNQNRQSVGWDDISLYAKAAAVSVEDPRFYTHNGIDLQSGARAVLTRLMSSGQQSGASTISMQLIKNMRVQKAEEIKDEAERKKAYEEATEETSARKLSEMRLAIGLEKDYTKDQILLSYLNISNFGARVYGIQAAANYYYSKNAKDLTLAEAASLIAIVNAPEGLRIDKPENIAKNQFRRDNDVLPAMLREKAITQEQYEEALATPVTPKISPPSTGCVTAEVYGAGFFCDFVKNIVKNDPVFGATKEEREDNLNTAGYQIYTTLNLDLQKKAYETMNEFVPLSSPRIELGSVADMVEPGTGRVLAMAQNKKFAEDSEVLAADPESSAVNYSTDFEYGGSTGFQTGSTYKVFTLMEWLKQGYGLNDVVNGDARPINKASFKNSCGPPDGGTFNPKNDGGGNAGTITVQAALAGSVNLAFLSMAQKLDQCGIKKTAEAFGVHRADGNDLQSNVSAVLGTNEIAPLTMAAAFAGIAAGGMFCTPIAIDSITDAKGTPLPAPPKTCNQAIDPKVAITAAYAMKAVFGGTASASNPADGTEHIGKTGTTDSATDTWMIGASTKVSLAVWVGNTIGKVSLSNFSFGGGAGNQVRHKVFRATMRYADELLGGDRFAGPDAKLLSGAQVAIPNLAGSSMENARTTLDGLGFDAVLIPDAIDSEQPAGTVAATDPPAGSSTNRGGPVKIYPSNGSLTALPNVVGQKISAATNALAGWRVSQSVKIDNSCVPDLVLSQTPAAGFAKKDQTVVNLVVCKRP